MCGKNNKSQTEARKQPLGDTGLAWVQAGWAMTEGLAAALSSTQRSFEVQSFHLFRGKYFLTKSLTMNECIK